jgi:hypothetical protein
MRLPGLRSIRRQESGFCGMAAPLFSHIANLMSMYKMQMVSSTPSKLISDFVNNQKFRVGGFKSIDLSSLNHLPDHYEIDLYRFYPSDFSDVSAKRAKYRKYYY